MKFLNYRLFLFMVLLCMIPVMTYAWTQSFSYESVTPYSPSPVIDVRVTFGAAGSAGYTQQFNGLYVNTGIIKLSSKTEDKIADCFSAIEIAHTGSNRWRRFENPHPTLEIVRSNSNEWQKFADLNAGYAVEAYVNRCGNNTFKIQHGLSDSYALYVKGADAVYRKTSFRTIIKFN